MINYFSRLAITFFHVQSAAYVKESLYLLIQSEEM